MSTQLKPAYEMGAPYALKSLADVEAVKDDPATWLTLDEFWQD